MSGSITTGRWVSLAALVLLGCSGSDGKAGASSLVAVETLDADKDCPAGGTVVRTGVDQNGDGELSEDEVTGEQILCNAAPELVSTESEPEGDNCVAGGTAFHTGIDENGNRKLDEDEIDHTAYVCNGVPGQNLLSLVSTEAEPAGDNCEFGGVAVRSGVDDNGDSLLQPGEVNTTTYACNSSGTASLVRQVDEEPGDNCTDGGIAVLSGMDTDGDGYLDGSEATQTSYVCHGAQGNIGKNGQDSLFDLKELAAGTDCAAGGFLVRSGLDANGDGELSDDEVQASQTLCNGGEQAIRVTDALWGGVCARGGVEIETGLDANGDGALQDSEVERTEYACNAAFASISAGSEHTCAVLTNGTVRCWGSDLSGQLGNGNVNDSAIPTLVNGLSGVSAIDAGSEHTCALLTDGTVFCWGNDSHGQLGDGTNVGGRTPVLVSDLSNATGVSAGITHSCAVLDDGTASCWGDNASGQLGDGTANESLAPVPVSDLSDVSAISGGLEHTCALLSDGTVSCWGDNTAGQLGDGTTTSSSTPVPVSDLTDVVAVSAGSTHTCALLSNGTVSCWGDNSVGELGVDDVSQSSTPIPVAGLSGASAITAGSYFTCALLSDGTASCWGLNTYGQLGSDSADAFSSTQVAVTGLSNVSTISAGVLHACVVVENGAAFCWGNNEFGQLGDGTTNTVRLTPVPVAGW